MDASPVVEGDRGGEAGLYIQILLVLANLFFFFLCYNFVYINRISFQNLSSLLLEPALCWGAGKALSSPAGIGRPRSGGWRFTAAAGFQVRALRPGGN